MFSIPICVAYMAQRASPTAVLHRELTMSLSQSNLYQQSTALTQYMTQYELVLYSESTEPVSGTQRQNRSRTDGAQQRAQSQLNLVQPFHIYIRGLTAYSYTVHRTVQSQLTTSQYSHTVSLMMISYRTVICPCTAPHSAYDYYEIQITDKIKDIVPYHIS